MASATLVEQIKGLANQLRNLLRLIDVYSLPRDQQRLIAIIKRLAEDVRLDVRDYEFASTQLEQEHSKVIAKDRLQELQTTILKASEYNLFGPSEVATLSAQAEAIADAL